MRWHCIPDRMTVEVFGYHFFVFQAIFSNFQSFFQPGSLNGAVRSDPTPLHNEAIFTKSGKIKVSLYSKSFFFWVRYTKFWLQYCFGEPLNINKSIFISLDNLLYENHMTGKMKVPLSTKICFLVGFKQFWLQHCFITPSWFLPSFMIYYMKITKSGKMNLPL